MFSALLLPSSADDNAFPDDGNVADFVKLPWVFVQSPPWWIFNTRHVSTFWRHIWVLSEAGTSFFAPSWTSSWKCKCFSRAVSSSIIGLSFLVIVREAPSVSLWEVTIAVVSPIIPQAPCSCFTHNSPNYSDYCSQTDLKLWSVLQYYELLWV